MKIKEIYDKKEKIKISTNILESHPDGHYARTRRFYTSVSFKPVECLPELWGHVNPSMIMIQHIG